MRRREERGTTFADVLISTVVVSTAIVATMTTVADSARVYDYFANGPYTALLVAQEVHEAALTLPWEADPAATEGLFGPDVFVIQDLDGKSIQPARTAEFSTITNPLNWKQQVEINEVDPNDPSIPAYLDPDALLELEVKVFDPADTLVGTFTWWMSPP